MKPGPGVWIQASRLPSQIYIFFPLLLGQALYYAVHGSIDYAILVAVHLFGLFDQLYIVYANDPADLETDRLNKTFTPFSGGSRVLVQGLIKPEHLKIAAWLCAVLALLAASVPGMMFGRFLPLLLAALGLLLLWCYSYPPLRFSYRGGGELLQMIGVGGILPLIGFLSQGGALDGFPWKLMPILLITALATAFSTTLPDQPSDAKSNKRTLAVLLGVRPVATLILVLHLAALALLFGQLPEARNVVWAPLAALLASLPRAWRAPGSKGLFLFVALTIFTNFSLLLGLVIHFFTGGPP